MSYIIESAKKVAVTTQAQDVDADCRSFLAVNTSQTATVYFREKGDDGKEVTADNGFVLLPGTMTPVVLCAKTLSVMATEAADLRLLFVR